MSRIGRKPIALPQGVSVAVDGAQVRVKGRHGELTHAIPTGIRFEIAGNNVQIQREGDAAQQRAYHGLVRALVANSVAGVNEPFTRKLEIVGIGYRAEVKGETIVLSLGYSHPIEYRIPAGIQVTVEKQTLLTIRGIDKQKVGQVAAELRDFRRPDVYKGKGVRYHGEQLKQKVGKSGGK